MSSMSNRKKIWIAAAALAVLIALFATIYFLTLPQPAVGAKALTVAITHGDGSRKEVPLHTDAEYLRGALEEQSLIAGDEGPYGLFVKTVDGETVDEAKQQWWCFTRGGEALNTGVDTTPVHDGEQYEIVLTTGY